MWAWLSAPADSMSNLNLVLYTAYTLVLGAVLGVNLCSALRSRDAKS